MKITRLLNFSLCIVLLVLAAHAADEPLVLPLWPGGAPGSAGRSNAEKVRITEQGEHVVSGIHQPSLTIFLPEKGQATGAGVVVCPGGGHRELWMDHEGYAVGRWLAAHGIAGFILQYRLAREPGSTYRIEVESLADAQQALRFVRRRAAEWAVDPARVGIMGFSAGGELAALAAMRFDSGHPDAADPVLREGCRPAFQVLVYPGNAESIVPGKETPPAFLACGYDDRSDISEGLARAYLRFKHAGVPAELHIYMGAGHGFGMRDHPFPASTWPDRLRDWLKERGFLTSAKPGT